MLYYIKIARSLTVTPGKGKVLPRLFLQQVFGRENLV
jgi:hypothetical protein